MIKSLKKIGNAIFYIVMIGILVFSFFFVKSTRLHKMPSVGGYSMYIVQTPSMAPTIIPGDLVIVKNTNPEDIKKGDIITFKGAEQGYLFTHRVYDVKKYNNIEFVTKGDGNETVDPSIASSNQVVGKLSFTIPYIGYVITYMQDNWPLILMLIIGITILIMLLKKYFNLSKTEEK